MVGRNQEGNHRILALAKKKDILLKVQDCGSPVTLLQGEAGAEEISLANAITARYSDAQGAEVAVHYGTSYATLGEAMLVSSSDKDELTRLPI